MQTEMSSIISRAPGVVLKYVTGHRVQHIQTITLLDSSPSEKQKHKT